VVALFAGVGYGMFSRAALYQRQLQVALQLVLRLCAAGQHPEPPASTSSLGSGRTDLAIEAVVAIATIPVCSSTRSCSAISPRAVIGAIKVRRCLGAVIAAGCMSSLLRRGREFGRAHTWRSPLPGRSSGWRARRVSIDDRGGKWVRINATPQYGWIGKSSPRSAVYGRRISPQRPRVLVADLRDS